MQQGQTEKPECSVWSHIMQYANRDEFSTSGATFTLTVAVAGEKAGAG